MNIKRLVIENFKSIEKIELENPNPFTVFVGPNGSGKSNIFEALEFAELLQQIGDNNLVRSLFGGGENFGRRQSNIIKFTFECNAYDFVIHILIDDTGASHGRETFNDIESYKQFTNFTRLFIGNERLVKLKYTDNKRLTLSASNMETVLKRLLTDTILKEEIHEWLDLFIPGFKAVEVVSGTFDSKDTLLVYEAGIDKPFTKDLISDGTYYIITLLVAVYQSDEPQFLCIEEPENGLHPQVMMSLVEFFRKICEEKGHYIWLNTHSEAIVRKLSTDEIVLVDKRNGATQTRQIKGRNIYDIPTDEAWLTGALGGGLPW
ncbi:AAA family ATPase [Fibrella aquatilis]|uniref:AAA family ATPase n=1 Tax=Fibrella aquatilis TaxID=2817059 RepID=A0A939JVW1_9BACT|nr:AAA family ATPase [Fibrella aquatilis]MBO0931267.1 AAA family ATPase [Fibrella aquatilis]